VKGKKSYFKRSGDSFFEMEHYDIEDAFKRNSVPELEFAWRADRTQIMGRNGEGGFNADVTLQIRNSSYITAKYPYLYVRKPLRGRLRSTDSPQGYRVSSEGNWFYYVGGADQVINPETRSSIAKVEIEARPGSAGMASCLVNGIPADRFSLFLEYKFGCENTRLKAESVELSFNKIASELNAR
jgi:hypothetical protein